MAVRDRRLPELALFAAAAVVHTWPRASAPQTWSRVDNADSPDLSLVADEGGQRLFALAPRGR